MQHFQCLSLLYRVVPSTAQFRPCWCRWWSGWAEPFISLASYDPNREKTTTTTKNIILFYVNVFEAAQSKCFLLKLINKKVCFTFCYILCSAHTYTHIHCVCELLQALMYAIEFGQCHNNIGIPYTHVCVNVLQPAAVHKLRKRETDVIFVCMRMSWDHLEAK